MRTFLVVNPRSANGTVERRWDELAATIRSGYGAFEHAFTTAPGDATRLARQALDEGYAMVVALGGDGTMNEVVNGFFRDGKAVNPDAILGEIPVGTGGDFRKTAGIPKDVAAAAAGLQGTATMRVDAGRLSLVDAAGRPAERYFINIASFGMGGLVDSIVNSSSKALGGKASFFLATARAAVRYRNQLVRLTLDGGKPLERRIYNVAVANGRYFGGGMHVAPKAILDDGLFDVVALGDFGVAEVALRVRHIYKGTHLGMPKVEHWKARHVQAEPVQAGDQVLLDVDGEQPGALPSTFEMLPGAIKLKVPG
ncbi:MAG: diacylglycerol kinase family lipid kinase [Deltaproteobacteria bacterium]|nr:diacylglycerol kinase family lipid kinase [Deltaproteobacteria bacterium]